MSGKPSGDDAGPRFPFVVAEDSRGFLEVQFDDGGVNLLSDAALDALASTLSGISSPLLFRSGRPSIFAAGADMREMVRFSPWDAAEFSRKGQELFAMLSRRENCSVVFIDGDCFGGALDLAMSFDLRIASPRSRFSHPGAKIGIVTGFGGTTRWRDVVEPPAAQRIFLQNRVASSGEALEDGLIDAVIGDVEAARTWLAELLPNLQSVPFKLARALATSAPSAGPWDRRFLAWRLHDLYSRSRPLF